MFAPAVWVSSAYFLEAPSAIEVSTSAFSADQNLWAGILQSLQLLTALTFLYLRGWRFQTFRFSPSFKETGLGLALFALTALLIDIGFVLVGGVRPDVFEAAGELHVDPRSRFDETLFFYSRLNGFYEEFFFLTIVSAARHSKAVFLFSLVLRVAFHTYQGVLTALLMRLVVGTLNYFFSRCAAIATSILSFSHMLWPIWSDSLCWDGCRSIDREISKPSPRLDLRTAIVNVFGCGERRVIVVRKTSRASSKRAPLCRKTSQKIASQSFGRALHSN